RKPIFHLPPCGGGRRMSSRRDGVRRVGGMVLNEAEPPTRRLAALVGDLPHKGGGCGWLAVIAYLTASSRDAESAQRSVIHSQRKRRRKRSRDRIRWRS